MELPNGLPSGWVGTHVANDFWEKFKPKEWDAYQPLMFGTCGPNILQTLKKPVTKLSQLKGLKIRGTGRVGDLVKALGATPIPVEMVDLYESLRRGVIDGTYTPYETLQGFKIGEVEKYCTTSWKIGNAYTFYVAANKKKWDTLPPDAQKTILDCAKEYIEVWASEWNRIDIEGREWYLKQGGKILELSDAESAKWVKAAQPVVDAFKADLVSKGFQASEVDEMLKFVKERIQYWKGQEKARKIPTAYKY
jgi:TRAP-type C4-dicarboxylate transport system substrate-binding protein